MASNGEALKKYRENETEEQRKARLEKQKNSQRKKNYEKWKIKKAVEYALSRKMQMPIKDEEGNITEIKKGTNLELGVVNLMKRLISEETSTNELVKTFEFVRDTTEGKPTTRVDLEANITTSVEDLLKEVQGEDKY